MRNILYPTGSCSNSYFFSLKIMNFMLHLNISNFRSLVFHISLSEDVNIHLPLSLDEFLEQLLHQLLMNPLPRDSFSLEQEWLNGSQTVAVCNCKLILGSSM